MKEFEFANWIWVNKKAQADEYAEFVFDFECEDSKEDIFINIACDSNFNVYVNEKIAGFGQCADFPHYKFYDTISLKDCKKGKNTVRVIVWYYGKDTQTYIQDAAGVIFEVCTKNRTLYSSNQSTRSRICNEYENHYQKQITFQLGWSFKYYLTERTKYAFQESIVVNKTKDLHKRKIDNLILTGRTPCDIVYLKDGSILIDMREESVGFLEVEFDSDREENVLIAYGEYLLNGGVNRTINGKMDFSVEVVARKGYNRYTNYFRRLAGRFLQIFTKANLNIKFIGIRQVEYPVEVIEHSFESDLRNKIYATCVKTLRACMHEHYEDCPSREQAMYTMDVRNEMLCCFSAFGDFRFARNSLLTFAQGIGEDGILSLCAPAGRGTPIPLFSLIFPIMLYEYIEYSKDETILPEVEKTLDAIVRTFISKVDQEKNLIADFPYPYWNYYEWSEGLHNDSEIERKKDDFYPVRYSLILNCAFILSLQYYEKLCALRNKTFSYPTEKIKNAIQSTFYVKEEGLFKAYDEGKTFFNVLGNSYAILCGLGGKELAERMLTKGDIIPVTLSMNTFFYDALISVDKKYAEFIVKDIDRRYHAMLVKGATTFWETEAGADELANTGSLCHGWSAMPIYYYNRLNKEFFNGKL